MKKEIIGILVCTLLIATAILPVSGIVNSGKTRTMKKFVDSGDAPSGGTFSTLDSFENVVAEEEWAWDWSSAVNWRYRNVIMTPLVAELDGNLTNGSEIIFITYNYFHQIDGILRAIHGKDGSAYFDVTNVNNRTSPPSTPAVGDIDNDGQPEIIALEEDEDGQYPYVSEHLIAFEHDGTWKWTSDSTQMKFYGCPVIADLDGDGTPEIVVGDQVFNNTGSLLATGGASSGINHSCVANVDLVGGPEIIAGNTVYGYSPGSPPSVYVKWENTSLRDGYNAIGNFDDDPQAEIVLVTEGKKVYLLEHNLVAKWDVTLPESGGGPPTIEDYDGDGFPDIGVATTERYYVFNRTGDILWKQNITDTSSGRCSSTVFDLNCDGVKDVIYGDERNLTIYDGRNGAIQWKNLTSSITGRELHVVADVDNDGHAEIVVSCTRGYHAPPIFYGIRVFGNDTNWTCARKIWNQHSYHITNINDDATVPMVESNNWEDYNNYRVQNIGEGAPKICCPVLEGIFWNDVIPGAVVSSSFEIWNCGDNCSELDWEVVEWPDWGGQPWIFIPKEGHNLRQCTGPITIDVYVWAPGKPNWGWTGHITICNKADPTNCCSIPVSLTTPLNNQQSSQSQSIFLQFLKRFLEGSTYVSNTRPCGC
ncbi:MAG: VCBS repeat-containing protein [Thermoplasmatales archaeon]|nr:VCBS repeat-containing protein [Thermoplasmatales archaeon]